MAKDWKESSGLRDYIQLTGSRKAGLEAGGNACLTVYAGSIPASADDGIGAATALVTLTNNGSAPVGSNGLSLEGTLSSGALVKAYAETWSGTVSNSGAAIATFWRWYNYTDAQTGTSTTALRVQGTVGDATGAFDMLVDDVVFTDSVVLTLPSFIYRHPRDRAEL